MWGLPAAGCHLLASVTLVFCLSVRVWFVILTFILRILTHKEGAKLREAFDPR